VFVMYGDKTRQFYGRVTDGQGTKWRRNIAENFNRLSSIECTNVTDDRQTTDRQTDRPTDDDI